MATRATALTVNDGRRERADRTSEPERRPGWASPARTAGPQVGVIGWSAAEDRMSLDATARQIYGVSDERQLPAARLLERVVHPDELDAVRATIWKALRSDDWYVQVAYALRRDGSSHAAVLAIASIVRDGTGAAVSTCGQVLPIGTAGRDSAAAAQTVDALLVESDGTIARLGGRLTRWLGLDQEDDLIGAPVDDIIAEPDRDAMRRALADADRGPARCSPVLTGADGSLRRAWISVTMLGDQGDRRLAVLSVPDAPAAVSPAGEPQNEPDSWRGAYDAVDAALDAAAPGGVSVAAVDIHRFDDLVASVGRARGEAVIDTARRRIAQSMPGATVLRLDAHRLLVLHPEDHAIEVAGGQRMTEAIGRPFCLDDITLHLQASAGVACGSRLGGAVDLIGDAELALENAMRTAKPSTVRFEPRMRPSARARLGAEHGLRGAIALEQLRLSYQPVTHLQPPHRVVAIAALMRWQHPERGLLTADEFRDGARAAGLTNRIDTWTLDQALAQWGRWTAPPRSPIARLTLLIEVSHETLDDPAFPDRLAEQLSANDVSPERVGLVVGQHAFRGTVASRSACAVQALGVRIIASDLEAGYAAMTESRGPTAEGLNLHASDVLGTQGRPSMVPVVHAALQLAARANLAAIAVGLETRVQLERLQQAGCCLGQGDLLAAPLEPHQLLGAVRLSHGELFIDGVPTQPAPASTSPTTAAARPAAASATVRLSDVCDMLNVSPSTVRRWADQGRIQTVRTSGGHRRFRLADAVRLRAETHPSTPRVRTREMPAEPAPKAASMLRAGADQILTDVTQRMYEPDAAGWFSTPDGLQAGTGWLAALTDAMDVGDTAAMTASSQSYLQRAQAGDTTLLERFSALDRLGRAIAATAQRAGCARTDLLYLRRVIEAVLDLALAHDANTAPPER